MSPSAVALAALLHALAALALWRMSMIPPRLPPPETPIDVTIEQLKAPEPPPPAAPAKKEPPPPRAPAPPVEPGLRPPAAITADKPTQVPRPQPPEDVRPPQPQALEPAVPQPPSTPPPPTPPAAPPKPAPPPSPLALPPQTHGSLPSPPAKPSPPSQRPELRPSPLTPPQQQRRPPSVAPAEEPAPTRFVNPADVYNRARVSDNYLWQVIRKLSGYHYYADVKAERGVTVVRVVIARDGRLLDIGIAQSSGYPAFDNGVVAGVRGGSPYAPLPPEIKGDRATFTLPLVSIARQ